VALGGEVERDGESPPTSSREFIAARVHAAIDRYCVARQATLSAQLTRQHARSWPEPSLLARSRRDDQAGDSRSTGQARYSFGVPAPALGGVPSTTHMPPIFACSLPNATRSELAQTTQPADEEEPPTPPAAPAPGAGSATDLAKSTQNPVANLISLPFQNNTNFGVGPHNRVQNVLNIQPVVPIDLGENWLLINRAILPVIYQPEVRPGTGDDFGLGDLQYAAFFSPKNDSALIWGVGPVFRFPTATDTQLGAGKWSAGPSAVALVQKGPWVVGGLAQQLFSICGDGHRRDVSELLIQPFVNFNLQDGWYLTSAPIITANWKAPSNDHWTVPLGGGVGKVFFVGKQPMNLGVQAYYNVEKPTGGADWTLRVQLQLLFPKG
jgi:hypothetical protein